MRLFALMAASATKRSAQAFFAGVWAIVTRSRISWRLQAMGHQFGQSPTIGSMPQLLFNGEAMLVVEEATPLFIEPLQGLVDDAVHCHDARIPARAIYRRERCRT